MGNADSTPPSEGKPRAAQIFLSTVRSPNGGAAMTAEASERVAAKINFVGLSKRALSPGSEPDLHGITGLGGRGTIEIQDPRIYSLLPVKLGARLTLVGERVFRPSYRFTRFASVLGTDWTAYKWLNLSLANGVGTTPINVSFAIDPLSATMMLVVTGIGFLIHLYSSAYMWEDPSFHRFFV